MHWSNNPRGILTNEERKFLLHLSSLTGTLADELLSKQYDNTSLDTARGYLRGFIDYAECDKIFLLYFISLLITAKFNS